MMTFKTTVAGSNPFNDAGFGVIRILNGGNCQFAFDADGDRADIPSADFSVSAEFASFTIYGNGVTVSVIKE
jgi:hypothetical protein